MEIFTVGHSTYNIEDFINILKINNINCIVDVRSMPYSKFTTQYNKNQLSNVLKQNKISYIHMGLEFGARRDKRELYSLDGYLDFEKTRKDKDFIKGMERVKNGIKKGYRIALMCTEKDPIDCHRCILVGKGFKDSGFEVKNILSDGTFILQEQIERTLLDKYFKNRNQISFDMLIGNNLTESEMIDKCYIKRNKEIGYEVDNLEGE